MTLLDVLDRLKGVLDSLVYSTGAGEKVFASDSVHVVTDHGTDYPRRFPRALIRIEGVQDYGDHGDDLVQVELSVEVQQHMRPQLWGENQIVDGNRATSGSTIGAGINRIVSRVSRALHLIDTTTGGGHTTWIMTNGSPSTAYKADKDVVSVKIPVTALVEQEEAP